MIFIDIEMPNRCADCPCFKITRSDGEIYGHDGCQLMHLIFNEDIYYGKHIHNPFESRYEDCPLRNASDFLKTIADRPRGEWVIRSGCYGVAYCSECNYELRVNNTNFCPNCGADMRSDETDESDD